MKGWGHKTLYGKGSVEFLLINRQLLRFGYKPRNLMHLENKVALVTGSASERSIGWGIACKLASEGASLVINDIPSRRDELAARVDQLKALGSGVVMAPADLTRPDQVDQMIKTGVQAFGRLDIVCSNAGMIRWESFLDIKPATLRALVDINVKGNMLVCKAAANQMIEQGNGGRIVITSSVQTYFHFPVTPVYGATKHAMHIFVGSLALELASHNITVNHIGPGWVQTQMNDTSPELQTEAAVQSQKEAIPFRRAGTTEEMATAVAYFVSKEAAYTTGAYLPVDGGLSISKYSY